MIFFKCFFVVMPQSYIFTPLVGEDAKQCVVYLADEQEKAVDNTETYKTAHFYKEAECYVSTEAGEEQKTCSKVTPNEAVEGGEYCNVTVLNDKDQVQSFEQFDPS